MDNRPVQSDHRQETPTRERILAAAAAIVGEEGMTARLSVRAVAARAGVSIGSMRHHFPTQHALRDEVLRRVFDWMLPEGTIHDTSVPARDRLVACLVQVLSMTGVGQEAREAMRTLVESFIAVEHTEPVRTGYLAVEHDGQRRVESWLRVLSDEGALPAATIPSRARFLLTVLNGLGLERALPARDSLPQTETETLYHAVDSVLGH